METLESQFKEKIQSGENLISQINNSFLNNVSGVAKLRKKIKVEIQFLEKTMRSSKMKEEHLLCTNLHHFQALLNHALVQPCDSLLQHFFYYHGDQKCKICVDIVANKGQKWIKVISRNPKALSQISLGAGEYGQRSVLDQAEEYVECARENFVMFEPPEVIFHFSCGIERQLANELIKRCITISGDILESNTHITKEDVGTESDEFSDEDLSSESEESSDELDTPICDTHSIRNQLNVLNLNEVPILNLDVTTLVAYVSNLTNGGAHHKFSYPLLNQQAEWELQNPVKPVLEKYFQGKTLVSCEMAIQAFRNIVDNLAGPNELARTSELLSRVTVVPDEPSERAKTRLSLNGKVKPRSIVIFGTGDQMKAVTTTANDGFLRAAKNQGVYFATFLHESRALSERKEIPDSNPT
uniref:UPF0415 protein C7orf25 homolog n=2 Tax=Cacopsylla melanoneura TaxID=428564 RepID=A0A8D8RSE9_9HEMI